MGSCCCASTNKSLTERLIVENKISIYTVSWNVGACQPTEIESLDSLFKPDRISNPDVYIIGLQEIVELNASNMMRGDKKIIDVWRAAITKSLGSNYRHIESIRLMGILLFVFCTHELQNEIQNIVTNTIGAGIFGVAGNKGAVGLKFDIFDTSMCVICCHLASGKENCKKRNENYHKIMQKLTFPELTVRHHPSHTSMNSSSSIASTATTCSSPSGSLPES